MDENELIDKSIAFLNENFYWHLRFVELASLSPFQHPLRKIIGRGLILFCYIHAIGANIAAIFEEYFSKSKDFELYIELLFETLCESIFAVGFFVALINETKIKEILLRIVLDYLNAEAEVQKIMKESMSQLYFISIGFAILLYSMIITIFVIPFVTPMAMNLVFNTTYEPAVSTHGDFGINRETHIVMLFFYVLMCLTFIITGIVAAGQESLIYVAYAKAKLKAVNYRFEKVWALGENNSANKDGQITKIVHKEIIKVARDQNLVYALIKSLAEMTEIIFLYTTFLFLCNMAVAGSMIIIEAKRYNIQPCLKFFFSFVSMMFAAFLMSFVGHDFLNSSDDMFSNCYDCGWYNMPLKTRKLILFIMLRNSMPIEIKAGPTIPINFETFMKLFKTSMSYITVMISLV